MATLVRSAGGAGLSLWTTLALAATPVAIVATAAAVQQLTSASTAASGAVNAGGDQTITLPTNQVTLNGQINGVRAQWVIRAGADRASLSSSTSAVTTATFRTSGTYKFELQSFDARGRKIGADSVKVFVQPAPKGAVWRERILNSNGTINAAEYRFVANNANTAAMIDYQLGPKYADFSHAGETPAPTLWGPDMKSGQGLWPYGTQPTNNPGEPEKCLPPDQLPRSDQEEAARGLQGAGWLVGGQHGFVPDDPSDPDYRFGISNTRGADGAVFNTGGLCMRMIASWQYDWWNRNNIATPANPQVRALAGRRPDLPLVPVTIARGRANASQISFAAFKDGTIVPISVGNHAPELFDPSGIRLPAGMVPTAMAVTPYNEFLVVSVWDTNTVSGKLAFVALRPREMAVGSPDQTPNARWYWGLPGAWTIRGMKLLGFVDLPFAAPTSVDVSNNLVLGNPRGYSDNDNPAVGDLSTASARALWGSINPYYAVGSGEWSQAASGGYAVVASRAENRVSFVNMTPLYQYYRRMYLGTQADYDRTVDASITDPTKWPFSFATEPAQKPTVVTTLTVNQPTSVRAGVQTKTIFGLDRSTWFGESGNPGWSPNEQWPGFGAVSPQRVYARSRAFIASMDGTVQTFNVQGLVFPQSPVGATVPATPIGSFKAGRNPRFMFTNGLSTAPDDLFLVSRGDRSVTFAFPDGRVQGTLRDSRLIDPVAGAVSINQAGYGGSGPGRAVFTTFISLTDFDGKAIATYAVNPQGGPRGELYPFNTPTGPSLWLFGSVARFPGRPFVIDMEEII